jgi:LmbE family N-acetylglucosaminyl deacetylase
MANYLFLEAHIDDVALCAGGTVTKLIEEGHLVTLITLSHVYQGVDLLPEWKESISVLKPYYIEYKSFKTRYFHEQRQEILDFLITLKYDYVFTHSANDIHPDHKTVGEEAQRAFKNTNLLTFTGEWNQRTVTKNYFVTLNSDHVETKKMALSCYKSQKARPYMKSDFIWANAMNNGIMCGSKYAESFQVVNLIN